MRNLLFIILLLLITITAKTQINWSLFSEGLPDNFSVQEFVVDNNNEVYAVGSSFYAANDRGAAIYTYVENSWEELSTTGILYNYTYNAIENTPLGLLLFAQSTSGRRGVFKSNDNGVNWSLFSEGIPDNFSVQEFVVNNNEIYAVGFSYDAANNRGAAIYKYVENSWEELSTTGILYNYTYNAIENTPLGLLLFAQSNSGDRGVFKSNDNGVNWSLFSEGLPDNFSVQEFVVDDNNEIYAVGSSFDAANDRGAAIYKYVENSWEKLSITGILYNYSYNAIENTPFGLLLFAQSTSGCRGVFRSIYPVTGIRIENLEFSYYPNPVNSVLTIESKFETGLISLHNVLGIKVYENEISQKKTNIDMSCYNDGIYFLEIFDGKLLKTVQVIKQ